MKFFMAAAAVSAPVGCSNGAAPVSEAPQGSFTQSELPSTPEGVPTPVLPQLTVNGVALPVNLVECVQGEGSWFITPTDHDAVDEKARVSFWSSGADVSGGIRSENLPVASVSVTHIPDDLYLQWHSDPEVMAVQAPGMPGAIWASATTARDGDVVTFQGEAAEGYGVVDLRVQCNGWMPPS